jgi:secreted trypsin-like serine protease
MATAASAQMGAPADTIRYPFVAALSRMSGANRVYFCAGTLIAPRWILTAGHCFYNRASVRISDDDLWGEAGADDLSKIPDGAQVRVARVIIHPEFDLDSQDHDIALVELQSDVGPLVAPLAAGGREPDRGVILGFASLYEGMLAAHARTSQIYSRLRQTGVSVMPAVQCTPMLSPAMAGATARVVCAGGASRDACLGDSGGPLVIAAADGSDRLAGIVSFGSGCADRDPVTVYPRVSAYSGWISSVLGARLRQALHPRVRSR